MRTNRFHAIAAVSAAGLLLAGCAPGGGTEQAGPTQTEAAIAPTFDPNGGASANKDYFDYVLNEAVKNDSRIGMKALVNTLVDAGFDKSAMEVTRDRTPTDLEATFVMIAVKMPDEQCLVGQRGLEYRSVVREPTSTGACLLGDTVEIDW